MSLPAATIEDTRVIRPCRKYEGHAEGIRGIIHLPGGQRMITCSRDGSLRVWNLESEKQIGEDWRDGQSEVNAIALSPDGKKVVSGSRDGAVRLWDIDTGRVITKWTGHMVDVRSVCWNGDGGRVVTATHRGRARVWDAESGETILSIATGLTVLEVVIYSPDSNMIATGGIEENDNLKIWDSNTGNLVSNLKGHSLVVSCLAWTADGKTLVSGSVDQTIRTWDTTTWQQITVFEGHTDFVFHIAISPNDRILASAAVDDTARLWNLENGQPSSPLQHAKSVTRVSFSTDGKLLVTACEDKNAYTWDVSAILREAGLDELLCNPNVNNRSFLDNDATGQRIEGCHPLPEGFFDDLPDHHITPPSTREHAGGGLSSRGRTILNRFFRRTHYNSHNIPPRHRPVNWTHLFSDVHHKPNSDGIALRERRPTVVDVPFVKGKRRNISAAEVRLKREKERNAKNTATGGARPPQRNITQQTGRAVHVQPPPQPHATVSTLSTNTVAGTTTSTLTPDVTIRQAGRWTRFCLRLFLFISCTSAEYTDGRHQL